MNSFIRLSFPIECDLPQLRLDAGASLGWLDSNQRMAESKSAALPLGYTPSLPSLFDADVVSLIAAEKSKRRRRNGGAANAQAA
jgi:hypothetical protein